MLINEFKEISLLVKTLRKKMSLTQKDLALSSGMGLRFIIDLEKGKPTCQVAKVLKVLKILGIKIEAKSPLGFNSEDL
jgi:HTH-type transcriptional regulator / antitoxin HipB